MSDQGDVGSRASFEAAVRSFTASEVALGEFVTAAQRFRSASESLERAQAGLELTRQPVLESLERLQEMAAELALITTAMSSAADTLARVDPERFWTSFDDMREAAKGAARASLEEHARSRRLAEQARTLAAIGLAAAAASLGGVVLLLIR